MTKIATRKPESQVRPVYVTNEQYEIWYSQPVSLGVINNRNGYWYTADNRRFASSRDAMGYLVHILKITGNIPATVFGRMAMEKTLRVGREIGNSIGQAHGVAQVEEKEIPTSKPTEKAKYTSTKPSTPVQSRSSTGNPVMSGTPGSTPSRPVVSKRVGPESRSGAETSKSDSDAINQNHPMFQQFMDFVDFQARRKMSRLDRPTE